MKFCLPFLYNKLIKKLSEHKTSGNCSGMLSPDDWKSSRCLIDIYFVYI